MDTPSPYQRWYGRDEAPVPPTLVRAGPVQALLDGLDLRYLRIGATEFVRRIYVAVRDPIWDTVPGVCRDLHQQIEADHFTVDFVVHHAQDAISFTWRGHIHGAADGTITYRMDGLAGAAFQYNRIGFCVLHPPAGSAGQSYRGHGPAGAVSGALPSLIAPQRIVDGKELALFPAVWRLEHDLAGGGAVTFTFEGDLFEMEDQRNWTDDSFKTYCTPLTLPWPHQAAPGQPFSQQVTIATTGLDSPAVSNEEDPVRLTLGQTLDRGLPPIGLGMASHHQPLSTGEIALLRRLRPAHLRQDLTLSDPNYPARIAEAVTAAHALGCALELAITISNPHTPQLHALAALLSPDMPVARVLVYHQNEKATGAHWVAIARHYLGPRLPGAAFVGGSNIYFTELNAARPDTASLDAVCYALSPQVHAFDERSLVETLAAQAETVRTAHALFGHLPVVVSPITLKPRYNPDQPAPEPDPPPDTLPANVDARQMSLFGAAWTLGSIKALAESGAASLTYYETTGWRGLIERESGPPPMSPFPSAPGMIFPIYHLFAALNALPGARLAACASDDPLRVQGLALRTDSATHVLVANMTPFEQLAWLGPDTPRASVIWALDSTHTPDADPLSARDLGDALSSQDGTPTLHLAPFAVLRIDLPD